MTIKADLLVMRSYLERGWNQGSYATDAAGAVVRADDPKAVSWCLLGAMQKAKIKANTEAFIFNNFMTPVLYNESPQRTQADILAKVDELIGIAPA